MDEAFAAHYQPGSERASLLGRTAATRARPHARAARPVPARAVGRRSRPAGGPGVYANILARQRYRVELIDVLPLHVEQAKTASLQQADSPFGAALGDAPALRAASAHLLVVARSE